MRSFAIIALAIAAVCGYLAWTMLALDLSAYNADQRQVLQFTFALLAGMTICGPILAVVALCEDSDRRQRSPHRYARRGRPSPR